MNRWPLAPNARLLVLTGAGVSAESGIPTFRDLAGLWRNYRIEDVASPQAFARDPAMVWEFYSTRRKKAAQCEPNPGHHAIVAWEKHVEDNFLLVTQNVDGLHTRAGSQRCVEMHGNLFRTRCSSCDRPAFVDESCVEDENHLPTCEICENKGTRALLRPDIVWFGEAIPQDALRRIDAFLETARRDKVSWYFVGVGTSGVVYPAAGLVHDAANAGATTILVNLEIASNSGAFDHVYEGPSAELLPELFDF